MAPIAPHRQHYVDQKEAFNLCINRDSLRHLVLCLTMRNSDFVRFGKFRLKDEVGQGKAVAIHPAAFFAGLQRQIFEERFFHFKPSVSKCLSANR
jgi:hypothetical protein